MISDTSSFLSLLFNVTHHYEQKQGGRVQFWFIDRWNGFLLWNECPDFNLGEEMGAGESCPPGFLGRVT